MVNKFSTSINGYSKKEVNDFVIEVTKEYEQMLNKLKSSCDAAESLKRELKHYKYTLCSHEENYNIKN